MKIVVLAGGLSPERDVSFSSSTLIANALVENGHDVMLVDLYLGKDNKDFKTEYVNNNSNVKFSYSVKDVEPDLEYIKTLKEDNLLISSDILEICKNADIVFLGLHGSIGENGEIQAYFDLHNIKYTGTGYIGSLLAMDKDISKRVLRANNILTADWVLIDLSKEYNLDNIKYPCVVKPCSCGSSVGISIVDNIVDLEKALNLVKDYENLVVIEDKIEGREFSVGILGDKALPVIEIIPLNGFYDYKNKYQSGLTKEVCPADITEEESDILKSSAEEVHKALRLDYYSRIDFILDKNNRAYCLEANTLPGMTPTSLLPQEAQAMGINYNELCEKIVTKS